MTALVAPDDIAPGLYAERLDPTEKGFDRWTRSQLGAVAARLRPQGSALARRVQEAAGLEAAVQALDDAGLRAALVAEGPQAIAPQGSARALALVREAARRSLGLRPFDTQLMGAAVMMTGRLAEMATGEGKTLTAALAASIAACAGVPVHVVTVNDYLAERDADEMRPLFGFLGLRAGSIVTGLSLDARRAAYACDITYCTNKELVFDYLKDRVATQQAPTRAQRHLQALVGGRPQAPLLLRGLHMAIVDEADSVLIDEARTPLILSEKAEASKDGPLYAQALELARTLQAGLHYALAPERRELVLLPTGRAALAGPCAGLDGLWQVARARESFVAQALRALHLYERDHQYIVADGKVHIVDEFTGRVLAGRTWEQGLHQLIETKEGCELSDHARTLARITYQRFFRRYLRLAGMTGTAMEVAGELREVYALEIVPIPTHRPSRRRLAPDVCCASAADKWRAVVENAAEALARGQPVLIGTRSVQASEELVEVLQAAGMPHQLLNARQDKEEAEQVARAGQPGMLTVATNMAGRGTDIKLAPGVDAAGGLHVILTEYHESARIDRQLVGRCARQGDAGSAIGIVAIDDALFREHGGALWHAARAGAARCPGGTALQVLRRHCQRRAGAQGRQVRRQTQKQDRSVDAMLAFTGELR
ncbi:hypothetical protein V4F39_22375 [Aquincola sp. MAHUQ-54]|uniref:Protein translocase subunit SecA n=1 Tax=Aquincola agrisoli TaxID=3119538 RepID=A0AAW9QM37_9BURK